MTTRFATCNSLADLYVRTCRWKGANTLFSDDQDTHYTGEQSLDRSLRFASALRSASLAPGDVVAFLCLGSAPHAVSWFGAIAGGYVASSLHVRNDSVERIAETLKWLGAKVVVHDAAFTSLIHAAVQECGLPIRTLALDDEAGTWESFIDSASPLDYERERPDAASLASIVLSSGSTGQPKGVMHSQATLLACAVAGPGILEGIRRHDTLMLTMNPSFAGWVMFALPAIAGKSRLHFVRRFDPAQVLELVERERVTILPMVPTMWRMVLDLDTTKRDLTSLRLIGVGGESPTAEDVTRLTTRICKRIAPGYMAGESGNGCAVMITAEDLVDGRKIGSTGLPAVGAEVRIVDPDGSIDDVLPPGHTGEIVVTGSSVALGYWRDPVLTEKKFIDGWWRSGDLGHLDEDGYLWVNGRSDNVINTGGIKVHAEEIEAEIMTHEGISSCAVVGRIDEKFGQRIVAYIVPKSTELTSEDLKSYLKDTRRLSGYKVPKTFHFISALPTGLTGKLDRRALRDRSEAE
ncbi:class I adenylate-forming enzyme family protein [Variovorax sp. J22G21]|uniref:class I adenylate-forming enzyme family protein n=1 Tax=Variovorax fucosicus TaxID=3053517 RepID=UPI0025782C94|nr:MULTISPECIES: class I adenylate-forming enzyme family protein [unclassified Variovorax]MDM0040725.1 class I adenylate-forming enzyme family protein [Variovorax sp. J22R193]MDM0062098.1 class I adenylate-forming enzyme family protein [Variovorax sp. J22G21]